MDYRFSYPRLSILIFLSLFLGHAIGYGQGTWIPVNSLPTGNSAGVMLLLSDGTVISKSDEGSIDMYGNGWDRLVPDEKGNYANGIWTTIPPMADTRLYFSTQVLKDGRVYVAGSEYGTGINTAEIYDPVNNTWTYIPTLPGMDSMYDSPSEILEDGRVMQGIESFSSGASNNIIFNPATNSFSPGPSCTVSHAEVTWLKLKDNSILFVLDGSLNSIRYIPSLNLWQYAGAVPVELYDSILYETGPAFLLPDGRAFFVGGNGKTAYFTPSGGTAPGTWVAGPSLPDSQAAPDAAGAMMVNGKILLATSKIPTGTFSFPSPMSFYEFDYLTNTYTRITAPDGNDTLSGPPFFTHMLNLPDGNILFSAYSYSQYFLYKPSGSPLAAGKPTIDSIIKVSCDTFIATGKLFNGITEGSSYGDDWQMATNYPLIRLTKDSNVYYTRTFNWNSTGLMRGTARDTTHFVLPAGLPEGTYSLEVVVNGNPSATRTFKTCKATGVEIANGSGEHLNVYPNPAKGNVMLSFGATISGACELQILDVFGRLMMNERFNAMPGENRHTFNTAGLAAGVYTVRVQQENAVQTTKLTVE